MATPNWIVDADYDTSDEVTGSNGSSYVANAPSHGIDPVTDDGSHWSLVTDAGPTGQRGLTGATGARGATGDAGARGAAGPTGPVPWAPVVAWTDALLGVVGPPATLCTYLGHTYVCTADVVDATVDPVSDAGAHWTQLV